MSSARIATAGWVAHALEEYAEPGQRFRFTGTYVGEPADPGGAR